MNSLYINGQDISRLVLGLADGRRVLDIQIYSVPVEIFFITFLEFFKTHSLKINNLDKCYVVVGPGSATALRTVLSIMNTIIYTSGIDVIPVQKDVIEQDLYTFGQCLDKKNTQVEHKNYLFPKYEFGPKITLSTKDALGREKVE